MKLSIIIPVYNLERHVKNTITSLINQTVKNFEVVVVNVYDIRSNVKYPFLMGYLVNWQAKIINPFLITISYVINNKVMLLLSILMQVFIYLITAHKSYILIPIAIIIIIKILEKRNFFSNGIVLAPIGLFFSYLTYIIIGNLTIPSLFIRRLLFVPARIKFNYYDFFF